MNQRSAVPTVKEFNTMSSDFHLQSILVIDDDLELTEMLHVSVEYGLSSASV